MSWGPRSSVCDSAWGHHHQYSPLIAYDKCFWLWLHVCGNISDIFTFRSVCDSAWGDSMYVCMYVCICICMCVYIYIYIYICILSTVGRWNAEIHVVSVQTCCCDGGSSLLATKTLDSSKHKVHDRNVYTTANKCLQCLIKLTYCVF